MREERRGKGGRKRSCDRPHHTKRLRGKKEYMEL
jgi:hypothetical protein